LKEQAEQETFVKLAESFALFLVLCLDYFSQAPLEEPVG
jgi:hypothetical protein